MTDPLTPEDLARMRAEHVSIWGASLRRCAMCSKPWPCHAKRLLDEVERLRGLVEDAALGFSALGYLTDADELRRKVVN